MEALPQKGISINRYFVLALVLAGLALVAYLARGLVGPLVIASLIAYLLKPLSCFASDRFRLRQEAAATVVYILFFALLIAVVVLLAPVLIRQVQNVTQAIQDFIPRLEARLAEPIWILGFPFRLDGVYADLREASGQLFAPDRVFSVIKGATTNIAWVLVIFVTAYYLLRDWEKLRDWIIRLAPPAYQSDIVQMHEQIKLIWRGYLRGQLLLMLIIGLISTLSAFAVGLPNAILLGLIAGGLDFIPTLGPTVATAIAAFIAWTAGSTYLAISPAWFVVLVVVVFQLIQLAESVWIQPRILGRRLHLHRGLVFVAIISALTLGSILLALIIVPLIASLGVIGSYVRRKLLGIEDPPSQPQPAETEAST
jgi:predicted PurR-regulated permease PerM